MIRVKINPAILYSDQFASDEHQMKQRFHVISGSFGNNGGLFYKRPG